jgi:hypothetical protein
MALNTPLQAKPLANTEHNTVSAFRVTIEVEALPPTVAVVEAAVCRALSIAPDALIQWAIVSTQDKALVVEGSRLGSVT